MRKFDSMIFMGGIDCVSKVEILKNRLLEGISILGGLQQPPRSSSISSTGSAVTFIKFISCRIL